MSDKFADLDRVLDEESWNYLNDNYPDLAITVQRSVGKGLTPEEISRRVVQRVGAHRLPLAQRTESAARHLWTLKENS